MRISDWSSDVCSSDLGDQVARVEREVEEGREVAEEFRRQVLCFVDDPQRRQLLAVDQLVYPVLDVAPQLRTAVGRLDAQGARQATVEVGTADVGFRQVDEPVAMGVEGTRQVAQGGGIGREAGRERGWRKG